MPNVAVVFTDAASSVGTLTTLSEAKTATQAGIRIYAIGASTARGNVTELQLIASLPRLQYHEWWTLATLASDQLNGIRYNVELELCRPDYG